MSNLVPLDMNEFVQEEYQTELDLSSSVCNRRIFLNQTIYPPSPICSIGDCQIMSLGDFSLVKGKAKSRKTFFVSMLVATYLFQDSIFGITPSIYDNKKRVLWFDTEQNPFH